MGELIRILQVVTQMNRAGLENRLMDIYRNIDKSKIQFDFYTCRNEKGYYDDEIKSLGGEVYYNVPISLKSYFSTKRTMNAFLKSHDYNIIHCHLNQWCGMILKEAYMTNIPIRIAHSRTSLKNIGLINLVKNIIKLSVRKHATHYLAVSKEAGIWLYGEKNMQSGVVTVFPNAIDCNKFQFNENVRKTMREKLNLNSSLAIIHVGNIRYEKNHKYLLDVFYNIKNRCSDSVLILVGADCMNGKIHKYAEKLSINESVLFLGARSDVADLLQAADVFVFPSLYEGFPGAVLEAQAAGLPCIISNTITDEVCLLETTRQLALSLPIEKWVDEIINFKDVERMNTFDNLKNKGYDIAILTSIMIHYYNDLLNGISTK